MSISLQCHTREPCLVRPKPGVAHYFRPTLTHTEGSAISCVYRHGSGPTLGGTTALYLGSESPVLESEALVVELVVAVGAVPLVVAPPHVRDAEPAPAAVLAARARQAVQCLICNRLAFFALYTQFPIYIRDML